MEVVPHPLNTIKGVQEYRQFSARNPATGTMGFHLHVNTSLVASLSIAVIATLVEAITFHSIDNLTLQVVATGTALYVLKLFSTI